MSWIKDVLEATSEAEAPKSFIRWAAYAAIAGIMRKNVFLEKHYYKLYPNLYVMLKADSGGRKGFPIWLAGHLVRSVGNTKFISGQNSIQAIVSELSKQWTIEGSKEMIKDAIAFVTSGEFCTLLVKDDSAIDTLTDLYDTHANAEWNKTLKSGKESLTNVCITMLAASNEDNLMSVIPPHAIKGGFFGRMLMIPDDGSGVVNSLVYKPKKPFQPMGLVPYLKTLSEIKGEFQYTNEGAKFFDDWYNQFRRKKKDDRTGAYNRMHDQILKVAMIISLAHSTNLLLDEGVLEEAITEVQSFTAGLKLMSEGNTKSEIGNQTKLVVRAIYLAEGYRISRKKLLRKLYDYGVDNQTLTRIQDTLKTAGYIEIDLEGDGEMYYRLTDWIIRDYSKGEE